MRFTRSRRLPSVDFDHMKNLHEECIEQLALAAVSLESAQLANDLMRDKLDDMARAHWNSYIEVIHLICLHDESMNIAIKKIGLDMRSDDAAPEEQYQRRRFLLLSLLRTLIRHHQRMIYVYNLHGEPGKDYIDASAIPEREYISTILEMIHTTL